MDFGQLSPEAKSRARQVWIDDNPEYPYDEWWSFNDTVRIAEILGIEIHTQAWKNTHGHVGHDPKIFFQLRTQGSGASFQGVYRCAPDCLSKIKEHAPLDQALHRIAERLIALQMTCKLTRNDTLAVTITTSSRLYRIDIVPRFEDSDDEVSEEDEGELREIFQAFADWIYDDLQAQYDYHFKDERINEELSEMQFDADGHPA